MICDNCKKFFTSGHNPLTGIPNGVKFVLNDKSSITMCGDCLVKLGKMSDEEKDKFFGELQKKMGDS